MQRQITACKTSKNYIKAIKMNLTAKPHLARLL
jgi:hypothetical protein